MTSRRTAKVSRAILETLSSAILFELKDPRIKNVTVIHVEVTPDIQTAKVYVSVRGEVKIQTLCLHGLNSARGFLQSKVADRLRTRYTPTLKFILDKSVKKSIEASLLIREALAQGEPHGSADQPHPPAVLEQTAGLGPVQSSEESTP